MSQHDARTDVEEPHDDPVDLRATIELLEEENRRLRDEVARAHQQRYRKTALALVVTGFVAVVAGVVFADARAVLFAIGATGLFAGVLVHYLTPGAVLAAGVGERVYTAMATNEASIADALGLADLARYVPYDDAVRLFVPHIVDTEAPPEPDGPFVTDPAHQGLLLVPTGAPLLAAFERASTDLDDTPAIVADTLADAVTEYFELADRAVPEVEDGRATFAVAGSALGDVDRFDHPAASLLAAGLARSLAIPVDLEVTQSDDDRYDWLVTCRWDDESRSD